MTYHIDDIIGRKSEADISSSGTAWNNLVFYDFIPQEKVNPNEKWIKHVHCDGARFHVLSWIGYWDGTSKCVCSEPDCIYNKG
jgi:hypothetical protein